MEENTNDVIYSNGIIIFNAHPEEGVPLKLNIKAGELYELAKHNIILLRTEVNNPNNVFMCLILQVFSYEEQGEGKYYFFKFSDTYHFYAETADDYPAED